MEYRTYKVEAKDMEEAKAKVEKFENRIKYLKRMQDVAIHMNNEEAYAWWCVDGIPDEPTDDDLIDIAEDDEQYEEVVETFISMIFYYGSDGILKGVR